jgi:membrane protease YdiL (CAAX protease family)
VSQSRSPAPAAAPTRQWPLLATVVVLLLVNAGNNVLAPDLYMLWAWLGIGALLILARVDGLPLRRCGLGPVHRRAALAALLLGAATAAVMLMATQLPGIDAAFDDERVAGADGSRVAYLALVRAPLGTALLEEVAFRGVLLAMLARRLTAAWAVAWSSAAFGAWHVVPALGIATGNAAVSSALGAQPLLAVSLAVGAAAVAGGFLCLLRLRYDHLIVPIAVHATANASAYLLAWLVMRG